MRASTAVGVALAVTALATSSRAVDGVNEINQVCAVNTGCFAGDAAGFPVTITQRGSYLLTGNLNVTASNVRAIDITGSDVTLDLNGFAITGPVTCSGAGGGLSCGPASISGQGVAGTTRTTVRNGSVRGFSGNLFFTSSFNRIENVTVTDSADYGIITGTDSIVSGCIATRAFGGGILASSGSVIEGNVTSGNKLDGINTVQSTVRGNTARGNGDEGIYANAASAVIANTAITNGGDGIGVAGAATVAHNTAFANDGNQIDAGPHGVVIANSVLASGGDGYGLQLDSNTAFMDNTIATSGVPAGTVNGGVDQGRNTCDGGTCP
jgi:parallel beta-helix repeat protein